MRIAIVSNMFPPEAVGGYEMGCAAVADHLRQRHEVVVWTSVSRHAGHVPAGGDQVESRRELALLTLDVRGSLRAPICALRGAAVARQIVAWKPDLVYVWNGARIPHAVLRIIADSGVPLAFRVEEHWFAKIFVGDQFLRELLPTPRGRARATWARACRLLNALPALRLDPIAPLRAAISWNSEAIRRMAPAPTFVETVYERVLHPAPPYGDLYARVERRPPKEPEIVFVGRITPFKGVAVAIQALALLRSVHGISATLTLAGPEDGDYAAELREMAARAGVANALRWQGPLRPEAIAGLLARASVMIVPSTWDEPFPYVTIEGALARVPLVASDVGGIGEGMAHEEHALLFARGDASGAAAALARILREPQQTAARVERAYEHAQLFRVGPYLDKQERFVLDALSALRGVARSD
jgi:glycogen synthase